MMPTLPYSPARDILWSRLQFAFIFGESERFLIASGGSGGMFALLSKLLNMRFQALDLLCDAVQNDVDWNWNKYMKKLHPGSVEARDAFRKVTTPGFLHALNAFSRNAAC